MKLAPFLASAALVLSAPALSLAQPYDHPGGGRDQGPMRHPGGDRSNPNWWRGRPEFRDYAGWREGFWYAPGRGYFRVDPAWYAYNWDVGVVVPFALRSYYVADPYVYGLPPAEVGFRYIYLRNHVALINMRSGRIVRMVRGVY